MIAYANPIDAGRTCMIFGNATLGKSLQNLPLVQCHAAIRTESGEVKGGHILTETSIRRIRSDPGSCDVARSIRIAPDVRSRDEYLPSPTAQAGRQ